MNARLRKYLIEWKILDNSIITFFLMLVLALILSNNLIEHNPYVWLFLVGGAIGIFIFKFYQAGIILIMISLFLLNWFSEAIGIIPRQITWLPEIILIILMLKLLFMMAVEKTLPKSIINIPILILIVLSIISSLINSAGLMVTFAGLRNYFKFFLFFYVIVFLNFDDIFLRKIVRFLIIISFIQVPIAILQRVWYLGQASGDPVGGTLGANTSGTLTLFLLGIISILFALYMNKLINERKLLFSILLLFIPMSINETKITFFLFPVLILFLLRKNIFEKHKLKSIFLLIIFSGGIFIGSYLFYNYIYNEVYQKNIRIFDYNFTSRYITKEYTKTGRLNRLAQVKFAHKNIMGDFQKTLLGVGPGNASDSFFETWVGYYYRKYPTLKIDSVFLGRFIWEYGYLGLAVFLFILFRLFRLAEKIYDNSKDPFNRSLALGFEGIIVILAATTIYSNSFIIDCLGYLFWFMAGYLQRIYNQFE